MKYTSIFNETRRLLDKEAPVRISSEMTLFERQVRWITTDSYCAFCVNVEDWTLEDEYTKKCSLSDKLFEPYVKALSDKSDCAFPGCGVVGDELTWAPTDEGRYRLLYAGVYEWYNGDEVRSWMHQGLVGKIDTRLLKKFHRNLNVNIHTIRNINNIFEIYDRKSGQFLGIVCGMRATSEDKSWSEEHTPADKEIFVNAGTEAEPEPETEATTTEPEPETEAETTEAETETNDDIIARELQQLIASGVLPEGAEIHTYGGWKSRGRQVARGQKSTIRIEIWKRYGKTYHKKQTAFFHDGQLEGVEAGTEAEPEAETVEAEEVEAETLPNLTDVTDTESEYRDKYEAAQGTTDEPQALLAYHIAHSNALAVIEKAVKKHAIDVWNKYAGKPLGEKTEKKICEEAGCGVGRVYTRRAGREGYVEMYLSLRDYHGTDSWQEIRLFWGRVLTSDNKIIEIDTSNLTYELEYNSKIDETAAELAKTAAEVSARLADARVAMARFNAASPATINTMYLDARCGCSTISASR